MASISSNSSRYSSFGPIWAGDYFNREHLLPGGARVDAAQFTADADGFKVVASGTVLGRTFAERAAGTAFGPAADTDDEVFILAYDISDAAMNPDCELYRHGGLVKENYLPNFGTLTAAVLGKIRAAYQTTRGSD